MGKQETIELKIMEWNIHQQGLYDKDTPLPMWIVDKFVESDIVVLTEYCHRNSKSIDFIQKIRESGYNCIFSTNTSGNDVLIAIKRIFQIVDVKFVPCGGADSIPENLRVDIKIQNNTLSVIGVRIKEFGFGRKKVITDRDYQEQALKRARNMEWLMQWVRDIPNSIVIAGDFNNYRRGTPLKKWNLEVIDKMLLSPFVRKTPSGQSIFKEQAADLDHEFPEDHFVIKEVELKELVYCRDFVILNESIYHSGKDLEKIDVGYPDHAILKGSMKI